MRRSQAFHLRCAVAAALLIAGAVAHADDSPTLSALMQANAQSAPAAMAQALTPVREAALRDTARTLGVQAGLGDRSRAIIDATAKMAPELDRRFVFSALMMGNGILPAVISEARNAVAVDATVMRVAQTVYRIDEPARPVAVPPTWRDWLFVGLNPDLHPSAPNDPQLLPRDDLERQYWQKQLREAYAIGERQAQEIFDINLATLERTYLGMRRFYELYARKMVTAPQVVAASSVIDHDDPNTVVIGSTVFRITAGTQFVDQASEWKPLGH